MQGLGPTSLSQFYQANTWKSPVSGDPLIYGPSSPTNSLLPPKFHPAQLGLFLLDMYYRVFDTDSVSHLLNLVAGKGITTKFFAESNLGHYTRESFVIFLQALRRNSNSLSTLKAGMTS